MDFVSVDVETANADLASICQVGMAHFRDGQVVDSWESLIDPEDYFDPVNIGVHGIDEAAIAGAPKFRDVAESLAGRLSQGVVISHTTFDRRAVTSAFEKHGLVTPQPCWLDTTRVVRRTWTDLAQRGYGLANVAERLGIRFQHHNAMEDARAAGEILVHAIRETGITLAEWLERVKRPITEAGGGTSDRVKRQGNPQGPLFGEVVVFTGALSMPRREAADLAAVIGCEVAPSITKATTLLVVGDQDVAKLVGHEKSSKHRKAEDLISRGQPIRILRETDFCSLIDDWQRNGQNPLVNCS